MSLDAIRVRLLQAGQEHLTGAFGPHEFKDGLSVSAIDMREVFRLASILSVGDEAGNPIYPGEYRIAEASHVEAPIVQSERGKDDPNANLGGHDLTPEGVEADAPQEPEKTVKNIVTVQVPAPVADNNGDAPLDPEVAAKPQTEEVKVRLYSQAELEAIADKQGIEGLRSIGEGLGVKNRSIQGLIAAIVEAQSKFVVKA